jgi:xylan 1,4-beta-xylosidase
MDLGNQLRLHRAGFEAVAASAAFSRTPIVISEADPDGCAACPVSTAPQHAYRNSPAYGAYEVAMMKHTLGLAAELGVNLRGVLTWAFTFPGSPYFAGYRALATNGIHLPVLNAFELLGKLRGARLAVTSSGARPLSEILANGIRQQPDVDALAASDGDQIRILVWHYHDDLVNAEPARVTLKVAIPATFAASPASRAIRVTHTRVDETHGNAFAVWLAQGSPEQPSAQELAALRAAMAPVVLSQQQLTPAADGSLSLSFDLPRFGISLFELAPAEEGNPAAGSTRGTGCSFASTPSARDALPASLALALGGALLRGRRRAERAQRASRGTRQEKSGQLPCDWRPLR